MATLTQLIEQYCPDGVEYVKLGDVASNLDRLRKPVTAKDRIPGPYPYYGANGIQDWVDDYLFEGDFVLLGEDGSVIHEDGTPFVHWAAGKIWVNNHAHILTVLDAQLSLRFLFHALKNTDVSNFITGGTQLKINQKNLNRIPIPLPPREVQDAIVERLDTFAALIESLDSEIVLREKRFEYFREQLLTFDESDGVEYVELGGVAEIITGKTPKTSEPALWGGSTPFVTPTDFANGYDSHGRTARFVSDQALQAAKNKIVAPGATLVTCIGASLGGVAFATEQCLTNQQINAVIPSEKLAPRFIYYVMQESADYLRNLGGSGTMPIVNKAKFSEVTLPLPSLEVQQDIADKLDTMKALIDNLKHERELRKAQFEYYREKLLTFNS